MQTQQGGTHWKNGVRVCTDLKTPFQCSPCCLQAPFQQFLLLKTLLSPSNHKFLEIFSLKSQISRNLKFQSLKIGKEFSPDSQSIKLGWNSVHMAAFVKKFSSLGFQIRQWTIQPFGLHTYTKLKAECPPPSTVQIFSWWPQTTLVWKLT